MPRARRAHHSPYATAAGARSIAHWTTEQSFALTEDPHDILSDEATEPVRKVHVRPDQPARAQHGRHEQPRRNGSLLRTFAGVAVVIILLCVATEMWRTSRAENRLQATNSERQQQPVTAPDDPLADPVLPGESPTPSAKPAPSTPPLADEPAPEPEPAPSSDLEPTASPRVPKPDCDAARAGASRALADPGMTTSRLTIADCAGTASARATVTIQIQHTRRSDISVELVGPSGAVYRLNPERQANATANIGGTAVFDASANPRNGAWTLRIIDNRSSAAGWLASWSLTV